MIAASMIEPQVMLRATCLILAIWGVLNSAQWLNDIKHWRDGTALGRDLQRLQRHPLGGLAFLTPLFGPSGLAVLGIAQLAFALALLLLPIGIATAFILSGIIVTTLLLSRRSGTDGGDKMALVALSGGLLQSIGLVTGQQPIWLAGILWTGGQLTIAYFASGAAKLLIARWRSGEALTGALSSDLWGHPRLAGVVQSRNIALAGAWTLMLAEAAFPLALLLPPAWLVLVLAGFLLLHLAIARVMGLNLYVWAFLAAYPSVLLLSHWLRFALGLAS